MSPCGVLIDAGCIVQHDAVIGAGSVLWCQSLLCHGATLGEYTFVGPKALVGAYTEVEPKAFIGQASVLISGKADKIGSEALIGAGSVVTKPVPQKVIVAGNPARIIKYKQ